jgi:hypothetical protein
VAQHQAPIFPPTETAARNIARMRGAAMALERRMIDKR